MKLSARAGELRPSPTLAIEGKAKAMRARGLDVVSLSAGEPDFDTPEHIKKAAGEAMRSGFTKYTPASGIPELKAAVAKWTKASQGLDYEPKQVVVSCGAKHAIANALSVLVGEGDEVLIPAPFWVSYPAMARLAGASPRIVYADGEVRAWDPDSAYLTPPGAGYKVGPAALRKGLSPRTRAVIINSPSNPSGAMYSEDELKALAAVLRDFPEAWIVSDEIYDSLAYVGRPRSIAAVAPDLKDRIIVVNGVSKTFAMTGWRIGWALGPEAAIAAMGNLQSQTTSNPTSIAQHAALAALGGPKDSVAAMFKEFAKRREIIAGALSRMPGVVCLLPDGAFYVFPDVRKLAAMPQVLAKLKVKGERGFSSALAAHLLETALVAVVPGAEFGLECHLRMSFATSAEAINKAMARVGESLAALARE